jgi:DnaJ-class molecular chaperone
MSAGPLMKCSTCKGTGRVATDAGDKVCATCAGVGAVQLVNEYTELVPPGETVRLTEEQYSQLLRNSAQLRK